MTINGWKSQRTLKREKEDAALRKYADGERTIRDLAAMLGWTYDKTRAAVARLGLKTGKDHRL